MALEIPNKDIGNENTMKRRGFAFAPHSTLSNVKQETAYKKNYIIRNRKSGIANSNNVVEHYINKPAEDGALNYMFLGRYGADNSQNNVNYLELFASHDTNEPSGLANGRIAMDVSLGAVVENTITPFSIWRGQVFEFDNEPGTYSSMVAFLASVEADGAAGLVGTNARLLLYVRGEDLYLDYDNLPTSNPGIKGQVWRSGTALQVSAG